MKKCTGCGEDYPLEHFNKKGSGRSTRCKKCVAAYYNNYYHGSEKRKEYVKSATKANRKKNYFRDRAKRYGITEECLQSMVDKHSGMCWICLKNPWKAVDHDHSCCGDKGSCGKCVRGLLCDRCNWALGHLYDDTETIERMYFYLTNSRIPSL